MFTSSTTSVPAVPPAGGAAGLPASAGGASGDASKTASADPQPAKSSATPPPSAPPTAPESQLKLLVAKAEASMAYTYTLVDQVTGRVVAEIPHQAAQEAAASPDYAAGGVVDTRA